MAFEAIPILAEAVNDNNHPKDVLQHAADEIQSALSRGKYVTHIAIHESESHGDWPAHLGLVLVIDTTGIQKIARDNEEFGE